MNWAKCFFMITLLCFLTGCYDKVELEQQSYVIAIGVDKTDQEGIYSFTFLIANPEVGSTLGGGSNEDPEEIVTLTGSDILSTTNTANSSVSKEITLDQAKVIIISEELARSGDFIRIIQSASRTTQMRRGVQIIVSKENANEFLNTNEPRMETRPHKYFQFMLSRAKETGIIPNADIHRFFQITEGDADLFLAIYATTERGKMKENGYEDNYIAGEIPQQGGNTTQFMGSAVFKEGTMIDTLNGEETRIALVLDYTQNLEDLLATYKDPLDDRFRITADYSQKTEPQVKVNYYKDKPTKIDVTVDFSVEILAIPSLIQYAQNEKNLALLKKSIVTSLEQSAQKLIEKTQKEYRGEPFYWSLFVRKNFRDIEQYEQADWNNDIYPNADITINYNLEKIEFGKMLSDSNLSEVRD